MNQIKLYCLSFLAFLLLSATFVKTNLELKTILDNKIEIKLPQEFDIMSEEMINFKYPSENRPTLIYTNEKGSINVAFNLLESLASQEEIQSYREYFVPYMTKLYPTAEWIEDGILEINNRKVGFIELISPAIDTKIYNLMFFTDVDGKLLLCTFNCTTTNMKEWEAIAKEIMNSIVVK